MTNWLILFIDQHRDELLQLDPTISYIQSAYGLSEFKARQVRTYLTFIKNADAHYPPERRTHLVIGDSHAKPGQSLERYTWLGRLIAERRPDVIINIGDWADMPSLSSYDKGRRAFEGRRYVADIEAANEALALLHKEIDSIEGYRPTLVSLLGNHEDRINRATNDASEFDGLIGTDDIHFREHGWTVVPFKTPFTVDGVTYCHYLQGGNSDKPVSGEYTAANLIRKKLVSCVVGHSHLLDYARRVGADGKVTHGLVCGMFSEEREAYAGQSNDSWWRGICILNDVLDGDYDLEVVSMSKIKRRYS